MVGPGWEAGGGGGLGGGMHHGGRGRWRGVAPARRKDPAARGACVRSGRYVGGRLEVAAVRVLLDMLVDEVPVDVDEARRIVSRRT